MTEVYVSENFDSRAEPLSETFINESVLKPVENSENLEDTQFCHLMTVGTESPIPQGIEVDDSLMTVDDSDDSSTLNVDKTDPMIDHPSEKIENQNVSDCVKFIKFAADQVATLYTEFSDRTALAPNLAKILLVAERKGGTISVRDAQLAFTPKFRPNAQTTRLWFGELVALNYGLVKNSGKSLIFEITAQFTDQLSTIASNSIPANVSSSTTSDPTAISCLQSPTATVDTVDEMIHVRLQTEPLQGRGFGSIVDNDLLFATSEKFLIDEYVENIFEVFWQTSWGRLL
jgi:hypothetical protein